jgi:hypothetical protein
VHTFIGILSSAVLPGDEDVVVPTIHVMKEVDQESEEPPREIFPGVREALVDYLATAFTPTDRVAAEFLLLLLLSSPTARPIGLPPVGTLSINFTGNTDTSVIRAITPRVVELPLSIELLHNSDFAPVSEDTSLRAGRLQLAPGTVLVVTEENMGVGGKLEEKAFKNVQTLAEVTSSQTLRYEYPYMDGLKMECALRVLVLSETKSLLPVGRGVHA